MKKLFYFLSTVFLFTTVYSDVLLAQQGSLDATFGDNGEVHTSFSTLCDEGQIITMQQDGRFVVAATHTSVDYHEFIAGRFNNDGSIDNSFGLNGSVITPIGVNKDHPYTVKIQTDGKVVLAGSTNVSFSTTNAIAIVRYNSDGSLDNTFGIQGIVTTVVGQESIAYDLAILDDGKILIAGTTKNSSGNKDFILVQYTSGGAIDTSFAQEGMAVTDVNASDNEINSLQVLNDGKLLVSGFIGTNITNFVLARYTINGILDTTFGEQGMIITDVSDEMTNSSFALAVQNDGKIIVGGRSGDDFAIVRYEENGILDMTFGEEGVVITNLNLLKGEQVQSICVLLDGRIAVAGGGTTSDAGGGGRGAMVLYSSLGVIDSTFGINGVVFQNYGYHLVCGNSMLIQDDGKIVVGWDGDSGFTLSRYLVDYVLKVKMPISANLKVFPNPVGNEIYFELDELLHENRYSIYDILGREIKSGIFASDKPVIKTEDLQKGIYYGRISENGSTFKFVKE